MEWALSLPDQYSIALHLSNIQGMNVKEWSQPRGNLNQRVLHEKTAVGLYTCLNMGSDKIEEALVTFKEAGVVIWAPEDAGQVVRIAQAVGKLFTRGIRVAVTVLIPLNPFPLCVTADSILDIWYHAILHPQHTQLVSKVDFLKEASRCIITRDKNPMYAIKNICAVELTGGGGGAIPRILSATGYEPLLRAQCGGEHFYVDVALTHRALMGQQLHNLSQHGYPMPASWNISIRSRGHDSKFPRETFVGFSPTNNDLESQTVVRHIMKYLQENAPLAQASVGRQSLFGNKNAVFFEGGIQHLQNDDLRNALGECIIVKSTKALCIPAASGDNLSDMLSTNDLKMLSLKYRKSGPQSGAYFARARAPREHVAAERRAAYCARQPGPTAHSLQHQLHIEVLALDYQNYPNLPRLIMDSIGHNLLTQFVHAPNKEEGELDAGEWQSLLRDGSWNGKILVQCRGEDDLARVLHGCTR